MYLEKNLPTENEDQTKIDFNKDDKYNGIIYFSSAVNKNNEYYLVYILDKSVYYLNSLDINSIDMIKTISFHISGDLEKITGFEAYATDTEMISKFSKLNKVSSYGFKIDGEITDLHIEKLKDTLINYVNVDYPRSFNLVKIENIKI